MFNLPRIPPEIKTWRREPNSTKIWFNLLFTSIEIILGFLTQLDFGPTWNAKTAKNSISVKYVYKNTTTRKLSIFSSVFITSKKIVQFLNHNKWYAFMKITLGLFLRRVWFRTPHLIKFISFYHRCKLHKFIFCKNVIRTWKHSLLILSVIIDKMINYLVKKNTNNCPSDCPITKF